MFKHTTLALALGCLAATAQAQACGTLTTTGNGAPGTDIVLDLTGSAPVSLASCVISSSLGTTTVNAGPFTPLTLGVQAPYLLATMGFTNGQGEQDLLISVPSTITLGLDLHAQAVAFDFAFSSGFNLTYCISNTVTFHVGP